MERRIGQKRRVSRAVALLVAVGLIIWAADIAFRPYTVSTRFEDIAFAWVPEQTGKQGIVFVYKGQKAAPGGAEELARVSRNLCEVYATTLAYPVMTKLDRHNPQFVAIVIQHGAPNPSFTLAHIYAYSDGKVVCALELTSPQLLSPDAKSL